MRFFWNESLMLTKAAFILSNIQSNSICWFGAQEIFLILLLFLSTCNMECCRALIIFLSFFLSFFLPICLSFWFLYSPKAHDLLRSDLMMSQLWGWGGSLERTVLEKPPEVAPEPLTPFQKQCRKDEDRIEWGWLVHWGPSSRLAFAFL